MMKKICGDCTLCCKMMGVKDLPTGDKPPHKWCEFCDKKKGCTIYDARPEMCRQFECVWLQDLVGVFPDDLRPDRCRVVLQTTAGGEGICAHCDPATPTTWQQAKIYKILLEVARAGRPSSARAGDRYWVIGSTGYIEALPEWLIPGPNSRVDIRVPYEVAVKLGIGRQALERIFNTRR